MGDVDARIDVPDDSESLETPPPSASVVDLRACEDAMQGIDYTRGELQNDGESTECFKLQTLEKFLSNTHHVFLSNSQTC